MAVARPKQLDPGTEYRQWCGLARDGKLPRLLLILPPKGDGLRWANSDPITGQAAWFDLRVKIAKAETANESQPAFDAIKSPVGAGPAELTWKVSQ